MLKIYRTLLRRGEYFKEFDGFRLDEDYNSDVLTIAVNSSMQFQTHLGFGGAFTEAAASTLAQAPKEVRDEAIKAYFSPQGLNYNLGRMSIHSNDFCINSYTYLDGEDKSLKSFDASHEDKWVVPLIKDCMKEHGEKITMFLSSWSPPEFMKQNKDLCHGGKLLREYYPLWAEYIAKFIVCMQERGIEIDVVATQNEPEAVQEWESHEMSAQEEADFVLNHLYPALKKHSLNTNILIWDHNRDRVVRRANTTLKDKKLRDIVWGIGYHWYVCNHSKNLSAVHALYPEKHLLLTECCVEFEKKWSKHGTSSGFEGFSCNGEEYGRNIINDFNNFSEGWIDWNLVLNEKGGPNHVGNFCSAPIIYDRETKTLKYESSYYYIGHFSKFILPKAKRLMCVSDYYGNESVHAVSYKNPNGEIVTVIQNEGETTLIALVIDGVGTNITVPKNSIITTVYKN